MDFFNGLNHSLVGSVISPLLPQGIEKESGTAKVNYVLPAHFSSGISVQVFRQWKLNIDAKWTDTKAFDTLTFEFSKPLDVTPTLSVLFNEVTETSISFPMNLKSTWSWALGVEYQYLPTLAFRFGYEQRPSATAKGTNNLFAPIGDAYLVGLGTSYRFGSASELDLGLGRLTSTKTSYFRGNRLNQKGVFYNPYAGYDLQSDTSADLLLLNYRSHF